MPDSVAGVIVAVAVILPGFVIAELSAVGRARASRADLESVLRALFYALLLHLVAAPATKALVDEVGPLSAWQDHLAPLMAYVAVVLVIVPVVVGYALGAYLRSVERDDAKRGAVYEGIGARDAGDAWDGLFQKLYEAPGSSSSLWTGATSAASTGPAPRLVSRPQSMTSTSRSYGMWTRPAWNRT